MNIDSLVNERYYHTKTGYSIRFINDSEDILVIDIDKPGIDPDTALPYHLTSLYINFKNEKVVLDDW